MEELSREKLIGILRTMWEIRYFEQKADDLFVQGKIHGTMHLSIGQEGVAAGAGAALEPDDYLLNTHRGHGHCIAKGADLNLMMAEFRGKEVGYCRGRGGSMHIADVARNNLGANGIVGGGIGLAMGVGLALKLRKTKSVVLGIFGDGASNQGIFHEAANMASMYRLPVVYLCENNQYAMSTTIKKTTRINDISERAASYGIPGITVDGNDVLAVYEAIKAAADRARAGDGPSLVEAKTYRWKGHSKNDPGVYRTKQEVEEWKKKDPIARFRGKLIEDGIITAEEADDIEKAAAQVIEDAFIFAESSPEPSIESIMEGVYA
jgi:acetoin:2,6-dichlorophenolindophenol oxidoreductase subunit alpha